MTMKNRGLVMWQVSCVIMDYSFLSNYSIECMCCVRQRLKYILPNSCSQVWHCFILIGLQLRVVTFKNQIRIILINIWVLIVTTLITWHIDNGIALAQSSIYIYSIVIGDNVYVTVYILLCAKAILSSMCQGMRVATIKTPMCDISLSNLGLSNRNRAR